MKPLATSQQVMRWLCMCPADKLTSKTKRTCYAAFTFISGAAMLCCLLAGAAFINKYSSSDFEGCLYTVFQIAADTSALNIIIIAFINRHRTESIFRKLEEIYTANEKDASFKYFTGVNDRSEWLWKMFYQLAIKGALVLVVALVIASIIYSWAMFGIIDVDHLLKVFKFVLPWDQSTLLGYFGETTFSILAGEIYLIINAAVLIMFISMCWHHQAFYERFRRSMLRMDQRENKRNTQNPNQLLRELIHFHVTVRDWFFESAEVYSPFVLIQLICNVIFLSAIVFQLDLQMKHINFEFFFLLFSFWTAISNLFIYCYFGVMTTESYEQMAECLYESSWHELLHDLQKKVLLMIRYMQIPVFYHGFGIAVLNFVTFIKFIRAVCTYYMMMKTLTDSK